MPRFLQRSLITILDVIGLSFAYWLAFLFRFEFAIPLATGQLILVNWPWVVGVHYFGLYLLGVPRMSWRYMTMRDTVRIAVAVAVSSSILLLVRIALPLVSGHAVVFLPF